MDLGQLISRFRLRANDVSVPYLWSNQEIISYLNEAENEAAERGQLIFDDFSSEACRIAITPGQARYALHQSVISIRQATIRDARNRCWLLRVISPDMAARICVDSLERVGRPEYLVTHGGGSVSLYPVPSGDFSVLSLSVIRLPLLEMSEMADSPEINGRFHAGLLDWALRCAYLKTDSDAYNPGAANEHEVRFVAVFGNKPTAGVQMTQAQFRTPQVRAAW